MESTPQARRKYGQGGTRQPGMTGGNTGGECINFGTTAASCYPRTASNSVGVTSGVGKSSKDAGDHTTKDDLVSISTPLMHRKTKSEPRYITHSLGYYAQTGQCDTMKDVLNFVKLQMPMFLSYQLVRALPYMEYTTIFHPLDICP